MCKRLAALALTLLMMCTLLPTVSADNGYNDIIIDWNEHTTHVYDRCDDRSCNVCGFLRAEDHVYDNACDADCGYCGFIRDIPGHQYDSPCDEECAICGEIRDVEHLYSDCDDVNCDLCGFVREAGAHVYDGSTDTDCNVCGALRNVVTLLSQPRSVCVEEGANAVVTFTATGDELTYAWYWAAKGSNSFVLTTTFTSNKYQVAMNATRNGRRIYCVITDKYGNRVQTETVVIAMLPHAYTSAVTKAPTCTAEGVKTYTCSACGDSYTEAIPALEHSWNAATCTAPKTCAVCGATEGVALGHTYTYPCDSSCDVCDATRDASHDWADATCTQPRICRVCGSEDGEALGHTYDNACDADCNICGTTREVSDHIYDHDCDPDCNVCDLWRIITHNYTNDCDAACNICGATRTVGDHVWKNGSCAECGATSPSKVTITTQTKTTYAKECAKLSLTVTAKGDGLKYQWYIKNDGKTTYSKSSVTSATYSVTMSDKVHGRRVYCVITDKYGNKIRSNTALLRRQATITKEPATVEYAPMSKKASIKITAMGDGLKYQWYVKNNGASKYTKSSITSSTYSVTMSSKVKGRRVYCVVTDKYGKKVQSKTFLIRESVSIVTQPKTVTVAKNKTAKVTVKASGDGLKYTWYIKNAGKTKYTKSSVTKSTYSVKMTSKVNGRYIYCVVKDKYGNTVKTVTVKLKMK